MSHLEAEEIVKAFLSSSAVALQPANLFLLAAFDIAIRYSLTLYDSLYLAVALEDSCPFVTADAKLKQVLLKTPLEKTVQILVP
ncbi:MAG: type II toxin-antitoxin system VapC family toxin [Chloroflexi bacterium]|nr:type II toxin-antitoxin system VapC family toxin [Chloroflexota bacterium]